MISLNFSTLKAEGPFAGIPISGVCSAFFPIMLSVYFTVWKNFHIFLPLVSRRSAFCVSGTALPSQRRSKEHVCQVLLDRREHIYSCCMRLKGLLMCRCSYVVCSLFCRYGTGCFLLYNTGTKVVLF